jgi:hypothetical protein
VSESIDSLALKTNLNSQFSISPSGSTLGFLLSLTSNDLLLGQQKNTLSDHKRYFLIQLVIDQKMSGLKRQKQLAETSCWAVH